MRRETGMRSVYDEIEDQRATARPSGGYRPREGLRATSSPEAGLMRPGPRSGGNRNRSAPRAETPGVPDIRVGYRHRHAALCTDDGG